MKYIFDDKVSHLYYDDDPSIYTIDEKGDSPTCCLINSEPDGFDSLVQEEINETRKLISEIRELVASFTTCA